MKRKKLGEEIRKSVGAVVLIGLGDFALLKLGNPIGPVIFALGLLGVCYLGQNLFTGKCGFLFENKKKIKTTAASLARILCVNLVSGCLIGRMFAIADAGIMTAAMEKIAGWSLSPAFFIKSVLCGVVMYTAVKMYKEGTALGILFGVPLFIFCGFQHCIANVITLGVAGGGSLFTAECVLFCAAGNFIGAILMWWVSREGARKRLKH